MTISTSDVLLLAIAVSVAGMAVALLRLFEPVTRVAREMERLSHCASELGPQVDRLLQEAGSGLSQLRQVVGQAEEIAEDLQAVSSPTRQLAAPLLTRLAALAAGARVGVEAFRRLRRAGKQSPNGRGGVR